MFCFNKNKNVNTEYFCQKCGHKKQNFKFIGSRFCFHCFKNTSRDIHVSVFDSLMTRDLLKMKKKSSGFKRFSILSISGWFPSRRYKKGVNLTRTMDKEKDEYHEIVKDAKTGKVVHEGHEKLSEHTGHGSAKYK